MGYRGHEGQFDGNQYKVRYISREAGGGTDVNNSGMESRLNRDARIPATPKEKLRLYARVFDNMREGIMITDSHTTIISINPAFTHITGYEEPEVVGQKPTLLKSGKQSPVFYSRMWKAIMQTGSWQGEIWNRRKTGEIYPEWLTINAVRDERHKIVNYVAIFSDISERKRAESKLRLHAKVFDNATEGIMITDTDMTILSVNPAFTHVTGYSEEEAIGKTPRLLHSGRQNPGFYVGMWASIHATGSWQGEIWNRRKNGEVYPEWLTVNTVKDEMGRISQYVGIFSDITERKAAENHLKYLAHFDSLTGLPNRFLLRDRLDQAILQAERSQRKVAVLFVDMDRFKMVNDSLGHAFGDKLLQQVATRLTESVRRSDTVSRMGGDEFILLLPDIHDPEDAIMVTEQIVNELELPFLIDGQELHMRASVGISIYPMDGRDFETLVTSADLAMYRAKEQRSRCERFTADIDQTFRRKIELEHELRRAMELGQLEVYYQPQVDLATGLWEGLEALLRWKHPVFGFVAPDEFIPIAEDSGMIVGIGEWVIREVCKQQREWEVQGIEAPVVAINLSARQLQDAGFVQTFKTIVGETGADPKKLAIEITENNSVDRIEAVPAVMKEFREFGVRVAIDDFGKGHSALSYLMHLPIDIIKIDKRFINDIHTDRSKAVITKAIVDIAHGMNLRVIAEGVETGEQYDFLRGLNCDAIQGYYAGRPAPPAQLGIGVEESGNPA